MAQAEMVISKDTFRRLIKDVKELVLSPLHSHGIYYIHNEADILKGKALIIGPSETPYENGYYLFEFTYPSNYPHSPPELKFCTSDGRTRFNPNLYINGKVCISILNTWQGEQWTSCQTITTVLLALCSILNDNPILNEPGVNDKHQDFEKYNKIITYRNFDTAILRILEQDYAATEFYMFLPTIKSHFLEKFEHNVARLVKLCELYPNKERIQTNMYSMNCLLNYSKLLEDFLNIKQSIAL